MDRLPIGSRKVVTGHNQPHPHFVAFLLNFSISALQAR
jgi:hypothetical protein